MVKIFESLEMTVEAKGEKLLVTAPTIRVDVDILSAHGETQMGSSVIRLFDEPPMVASEAKDWVECPADTFDGNTPALLEFRNKGHQPMHIFLTGFAGNQVVKDTMMVLKDSLYQMTIPYEESYADGMRLTATYVSRGEVYSKHIILRKRLPHNRLYMHWQTFRDYTQPGATEQWTLRVLDGKGLPANANVMLGMYDASLDAFAKKEFGSDTRIRFRPHHFPFTEPSAEVDISCFVCGGKGCRLCKNEGWIEILGAGMVHPHVLEMGGIDPTVYSGFAFGMGVERIAMLKYHIDDIRHLYENDVRFLSQF